MMATSTWSSTTSIPRPALLRNVVKNGNHWLTLKLMGGPEEPTRRRGSESLSHRGRCSSTRRRIQRRKLRLEFRPACPLRSGLRNTRRENRNPMAQRTEATSLGGASRSDRHCRRRKAGKISSQLSALSLQRRPCGDGSLTRPGRAQLGRLPVARAPSPAGFFAVSDSEGKMPSGQPAERRRYKFGPRRCMSAKVRNWSQSKAVTACLAGSNVIPDGVHHRLIEWRHLACSKILGAQQAIDRAGSNARQELTFGITPAIIFSARDVDGTRCDQGNQLVGIDRKLLGMITVLLEAAAEPVRKHVEEIIHSFAIVAPRERRAALSRTT